jgi:phage gpG-like protein
MQTIRYRDDGSTSIASGLLKLLRNPLPLMKALGAFFVADAQQAFVEQSFDGKQWPGRYPGQAEPFINKAGALQDLTHGSTIKARRFQRRPAAMDEGFRSGGLAGSISFKVIGKNELQVGSNVDHAEIINKGGISTMPITQTMKDNLAKILKRSRGKLKGLKPKKGLWWRGVGSNLKKRISMGAAMKLGLPNFGEGVQDLNKSQRKTRGLVQAAAIMKLGFIFGKKIKTLTTKVAARPFLGPSRRAMKDAENIVADEFREVA